jgi:transposase
MGRYSKEFKEEALRLLAKNEKPASELARELGIRRNLLYKWKDQIEQKGTAAFGGSGRPRESELSEVSRLKKELATVKEERDILKKAAAYFAKELG